MLGILDLFTREQPIWSTGDLIETLGTSRSTGYRYIKTLLSVGLLGAVGNGFYVLGPRIVELDLQIRESDPLHHAGDGILLQLSQTTGHSSLLCTLYSNSVLCIRENLVPLSPPNMFSRGQKRPMFRGAVSKVILAHLPAHRLKSVYTRNQELAAEVKLGTTWPEFRESLSKIRKAGYCVSYGEFNPEVIGIGAPIFNEDGDILGSVGVAWHQNDMLDGEMNRTIMAVKRAAREITSRVSNSVNGMKLPPRAIG